MRPCLDVDAVGDGPVRRCGHWVDGVRSSVVIYPPPVVRSQARSLFVQQLSVVQGLTESMAPRGRRLPMGRESVVTCASMWDLLVLVCVAALAWCCGWTVALRVAGLSYSMLGTRKGGVLEWRVERFGVSGMDCASGRGMVGCTVATPARLDAVEDDDARRPGAAVVG